MISEDSKLTPDVVKEWAVSLKVRIASYKALPPGFFEMLVKDRSDSVRKAVATNQHAPDHILRKAVNFTPKLWGVRLFSFPVYRSLYTAVAGNPSASPELLEFVFDRTKKQNHPEDSETLIALTLNVSCPAHILTELGTKVRYVSSRLLVNVGDHPNTSADVLVDLSYHEEDSYLRSVVAGNPNTPIHVLERLREIDSAFEWQVINNPTFITYKREQVYADLGFGEDILPNGLVDEIWAGKVEGAE